MLSDQNKILNNDLPPQLVASLQGIHQFNEAAFIHAHQLKSQTTSVRVNVNKVNSSSLDLTIEEKVPWCSSGYYLKERPVFTLNPLLHAGAFYVQEASSMFVEQAILQLTDVSKPLTVLDLCAAPGGKSTHLINVLHSSSTLICNEVIASRNLILQENLTKWGATNVIVTQNDAKSFSKLEGLFDVILLDAPCSGSGLFRKDENAINEWSEKNVQLCAERQQRIIADVLPSLKENGILIYSTCSYSEAENENIIDWVVENFSLQNTSVSINDQWGITVATSKNKNFGYRFWPHLVKGEGFFISCFIKKATTVPFLNRNIQKLEKVPQTALNVLKNYITPIFDAHFFEYQKMLHIIGSNCFEVLQTIRNSLFIKKAGMAVGVVQKNELIPEHDMAMLSNASIYFQQIEVNNHEALLYLKKEMPFDEKKSKGWGLITYKKVPLGFVKVLPNRINNYYPKNWRILMKLQE